jgi:hypothetical protein
MQTALELAVRRALTNNSSPFTGRVNRRRREVEFGCSKEGPLALPRQGRCLHRRVACPSGRGTRFRAREKWKAKGVGCVIAVSDLGPIVGAQKYFEAAREVYISELLFPAKSPMWICGVHNRIAQERCCTASETIRSAAVAGALP